MYMFGTGSGNYLRNVREIERAARESGRRGTSATTVARFARELDPRELVAWDPYTCPIRAGKVVAAAYTRAVAPDYDWERYTGRELRAIGRALLTIPEAQ